MCQLEKKEELTDMVQKIPGFDLVLLKNLNSYIPPGGAGKCFWGDGHLEYPDYPAATLTSDGMKKKMEGWNS